MKLYSFDKLVGNTTTIKFIRKSLATNSFPKVTLMSGVHGTGKSTSAAIVALSLTCPSPINGEACLKCATCRNNIKALETTGVATNIVKKDLGKHISGEAMLDIIKEIFVLQTPVGNNVYILEEAQGLSQRNQTALLEEIDRLDPSTYIILTTTKRSDLQDALLSRAIEFNFNSLAPLEQQLLFDRTCMELGVAKPKPEIEKMMLRYTRGIPRDLVMLIDFVSKVSPSESEIAEFLNFVDTNTFIDLLESMQYGLGECIPLIEGLLQKYPSYTIIEQFKGFVVDLMFLIQGNITGHLNKKQCNKIKAIVTPEISLKLCKLVDNVSGKISVNDLRLLFIKVCQCIQNKKVSDIVKDKSRMASRQNVQANILHEETNRINHLTKELENSKPDIEKLKAKFNVAGKVNPSPSKKEDLNLDLEVEHSDFF